MAVLYGREFTRRELQRRTGNPDQFGGVRLSRLEEGRAQGLLVADFRTGSGFNFTVAPDRSMDILHGEYNGIPLCWRSATGDVAPPYYEPEGLGWLRSFFGGILATCGLTYAGAPCVDGEEALGLHGRIGNIPATNVLADTQWKGDDLVMWVQGKVRESTVFGPNIVLSRRISTQLGAKSLQIHDEVTNQGHETQPHMIIYHMNMGYPAVSEESELLTPSLRITPRDETAAKGLDRCLRFAPPTDGVPEEAFYHEMGTDAERRVMTAIVNRPLGFGVYVCYRKSQLPNYTEWKMCATGHYVCGMEPANCEVTGRARVRQEGKLRFIEPGETKVYGLEFGVLTSADEVSAAETRIKAMKA